MTGLIIAIVVIAIIAIALFAFVMPRARAKAREREVARQRDEVATAHREQADDRSARADYAEQQAARERAEADLHETRARMHELVVTPVAGYGGRGAVVGPSCSAVELASLQAEVSAAPYRFVAQEPVVGTTVPTLVDGRLQPRHVDLRVLSLAGAGGRPTALPAPPTRVADGPQPAGWWSGASKDTWIAGEWSPGPRRATGPTA